MKLQWNNPDNVAKPLGAYSHSVEVPAGTRLVFVSGQVPVRLDGTCPASLAEQAELVYANLLAVLSSQRLSASSLVKLTTFQVCDDPDGAVRQARQRHLGEHRPVSTLVWVSRLADPAWMLEVEAIAAADPFPERES